MGITAYAWEDNKSKQVYASGSDSHIIELSVAIDQNRQCNDLTTQIPPDLGLAQADLGAPRIGYAWRGKWWKQVAYVTDDGHLHEISFSFAVSWSQTDLTLSTGAPPAVHTNISGYVWTDGNTQYKQYAYVASDGHIHEPYAAFGGKWKTGDLTKIVEAPPADKGLISGYAWNPLGMKQVAFRSADGHIHELRCPVGGPWMHTDITASKPDIPVADLAGAVVGYAWGTSATSNEKMIVFTTADGHVQELSTLDSENWTCLDLTSDTQKSNNPAPSSAIAGADLTAYTWTPRFESKSKQVAFSRPDGHIHELFIRLGDQHWSHADLTLITPGAPLNGGDLVGYECKQADRSRLHS